MLTSDFNYNLPPELIAQTPATPRDSSRLMVVDKDTHKIEHKQFADIINYLQPGDLLVWNNSKVFKARLRGTVELDQETDDIPGSVPSTNKILNSTIVEIFLVRPMENRCVWKVLAKPGRKLRLGMRVRFAPDFCAEVMVKEKDGTILMDFGGDDDMVVRAKANMYGEVPTPPYIKYPSLYLSPKRGENLSEIPSPVRGGARGGVLLEHLYQTVYAKSEGSVAAPTAGFHFTPELIEQLKSKGIEFAEVTLHVGLGTFLPVKTDNVEDHKMHSEWVELTASNADKINIAKHEGRRVVAVGTTTVRVLEGVASTVMLSTFTSLSINSAKHPLESVLRDSSPADWRAQNDNLSRPAIQSYTGDINIFITPGFKFQIIDALITNFHLPQSTLLMLICAFMGDKLNGRNSDEGREFVLKCYEQAVREKYRFYSFGDAMLVK